MDHIGYRTFPNWIATSSALRHLGTMSEDNLNGLTFTSITDKILTSLSDYVKENDN